MGSFDANWETIGEISPTNCKFSSFTLYNRRKSAKVCLPLLPPISGHMIIQLEGHFCFDLECSRARVVCENCTTVTTIANV